MPTEFFGLVNKIMPSIVKIDTPDGHGTGFFIGYNEDRSQTLIATANHVVEDADKWLKPIRIHNLQKGETVLLQESDRVIIPDDSGADSTIIFVPTIKIASLQFPDVPIKFLETGQALKRGVEVAWLGYPGIANNTLCFFCGNISARQRELRRYLIDGVAAPGVSGGPVFSEDNGEPELVGSITGYLRRDVSVFGLCVAHDIIHLQKTVESFKDQRDAEERKNEQQAPPDAEVPAEGPLIPASLFPPEETAPKKG
jgi:hypothetical protein